MSQGYTWCPQIAALDATGVRATNNFNYKGRPVFKTSIGAVASTIAYITIISGAYYYMLRIIGPRRYYQSDLTTYINADSPPFFINITQAVPALKIKTDTPLSFNITKYWVPVFTHFNGSMFPDYFPAVNCTQKF